MENSTIQAEKKTRTRGKITYAVQSYPTISGSPQLASLIELIKSNIQDGEIDRDTLIAEFAKKHPESKNAEKSVTTYLHSLLTFSFLGRGKYTPVKAQKDLTKVASNVEKSLKDLEILPIDVRNALLAKYGIVLPA